MITVTFDIHNERIISFVMSGHADYAKKGSDIVCAGASAVSFGIVNAIMSLTDVTPEVEQGQGGGYLRCTIPDVTSETSQEKVQLLLNSLLISLQTIERDYSKYIKISINE